MSVSSHTSNLSSGLQHALKEQQDFILFHLPGDEKVYFYTGNLLTLPGGSDIEEGFLIGSFSGKRYVLKPLVVFSAGIQERSEIKLPHVPLKQVSSSLAKDEYLNLIQKSLRQIENGAFQKVVISRNELMHLPQDIDRIKLFYSLAERYPTAFVYYLHSKELGYWTGSSPELLLRKAGQKIETVALAGTSSEKEAHLAEMSFKAKEAEEQGLVGQYIEEELKPLTSGIQKEGPGLRKAGNLFHLYTKFTAELKDGIGLLDLVDALHPTPAVGGYPSEEAIQFLLANEGYDRSLYSGFLGPVFTKDDAALFVNLRCMQYAGNDKALLYAGGGIVAGSDPEKEWEETRQKMQTLLQVIYEQ